MGHTKEQIEASYAEIEATAKPLRDLVRGLAPTAVCHCGTCQEALDTAFRIFKQTLEHQCPTWQLQVAMALISTCKLAYAQVDGELPSVSKKAQNRIDADFTAVGSTLQYAWLNTDNVRRVYDFMSEREQRRAAAKGY